MRKETKEMIGRILVVVGAVTLISSIIEPSISLFTPSLHIIFPIGQITALLLGMSILGEEGKRTLIKSEHKLQPMVIGGVIAMIGLLIGAIAQIIGILYYPGWDTMQIVLSGCLFMLLGGYS